MWRACREQAGEQRSVLLECRVSSEVWTTAWSKRTLVGGGPFQAKSPAARRLFDRRTAAASPPPARPAIHPIHCTVAVSDSRILRLRLRRRLSLTTRPAAPASPKHVSQLVLRSKTLNTSPATPAALLTANRRYLLPPVRRTRSPSRTPEPRQYRQTVTHTPQSHLAPELRWRPAAPPTEPCQLAQPQHVARRKGGSEAA